MLLLAHGSAEAQARPAVTGTYRVRWGGGAECELRVRALPASRMRFLLECVTAAPAHNMGTMPGTARLRAGTARFVTTEFGGRCEIGFRFLPRSVVVTQRGVDHECGFGFNVNAGGTYPRIGTRPPSFTPRQ